MVKIYGLQEIIAAMHAYSDLLFQPLLILCLQLMKQMDTYRQYWEIPASVWLISNNNDCY